MNKKEGIFWQTQFYINFMCMYTHTHRDILWQ